MLIAINSHSEYALASPMCASKQESYYCPACADQVIYRAGPKTIPHFAHRKNHTCHASSEAESYEHLSGKLQLFELMRSHADCCYLEKYLPEIQQKADVYFEFQDKCYALEFQCSTIPLALFEERTRGYRAIGITPIWIFHHRHVDRKVAGGWRISNLLQMSVMDQIQLITFNPQSSQLHILSQLCSFSKNFFFANETVLPKNRITPSSLLTSDRRTPTYFKQWIDKRHHHLFRRIRYEGLQVPFYRTLYESGFSTMTLPNFIGIPLTHSIFFKTPPLEWQGYLFLELVKRDFITLEYPYQIINHHIVSGRIEKAMLPACETIHFEIAVNEFIQALLFVGFLKIQDKGYQIVQECPFVEELTIYRFLKK